MLVMRRLVYISVCVCVCNIILAFCIHLLSHLFNVFILIY